MRRPHGHAKIEMASDRICVGQIGGAHGIRGEVKLKSFTADPMAIKDYAPLESEDGATRLVIEALRPAKGHLVARLHGIADRTAAERLTHLKLFVPRGCLPAPAAGEFYHVDLIGLRAMTVDGDEIGTVLAVHDFGAGSIIELRLVRSGASVMLPFTQASVPDIDIAGGRIVVVPQDDQAEANGSDE
jgi:16S rRNA processing protein RimM